MLQLLQDSYRPYIDGEKIETLFMFQAGTVWASMSTVYESCMQDERFCVTIALIEETTVEYSHMIGAKKFLERAKINYCLYENINFENYCPHIVFFQFPYDAACHTPETLSLQFKKRGSRVIYIPYGIEISDTEIARKDHFSSFVVENAWRLYTSCEGIKKEYDKYCRNRNAVRVCGSPKFDGISQKYKFPLKKEIKESAKGRKIVVWKMHFPKKIKENEKIRQITPELEEYVLFARCIEQFKDIFFIVLLHPKMLKGVVASDIQEDNSLIIQSQTLVELLKSKENVVVDESEEYRNSFYNADAIIMDRSGVLIEAAMLDIPVLFMKNKNYSEKLTMPVQEVVDVFLQGTSKDDMRAFIKAVQKEDDIMAEKRKECVLRNFPFMDGKCGMRIKDDIINSLQEKMKIPKIILFGTGEICRYYMEQQQWYQNKKFEIIAVSDSNQQKWGTQYYGIPVISLDTLKQMEFDAIVITTEPHYFEIKKSLVYDYYLDERKIWRLDEFVVTIH